MVQILEHKSEKFRIVHSQLSSLFGLSKQHEITRNYVWNYDIAAK